jgi:hypothetical protein
MRMVVSCTLMHTLTRSHAHTQAPVLDAAGVMVNWLPNPCVFCGGEARGIDCWNAFWGYGLWNSVPCCTLDNKKFSFGPKRMVYRVLRRIVVNRRIN